MIPEEPDRESSPVMRQDKYKKAQTSVGGGFTNTMPARPNHKVPGKPPKCTIVDYDDEDQPFANPQTSILISEVSSGSIEFKRMPTPSHLSYNPTAFDSQPSSK